MGTSVIIFTNIFILYFIVILILNRFLVSSSKEILKNDFILDLDIISALNVP